MCYFLSLAVSRDVRCGCDSYAFLSIPHSPCVAHFYHLLWVSRHPATLPLLPFPGLSIPPQAAGSFQSNLLHYRDGESGTLFKEQNGERGPESLLQASTMAVMYLRSER